jgi:hypothetical protein
VGGVSEALVVWIGGSCLECVLADVAYEGAGLLRAQIAVAFGDDPHSPATDQLAGFALAAIDGAFVASQTDRGATLERLL